MLNSLPKVTPELLLERLTTEFEFLEEDSKFDNSEEERPEVLNNNFSVINEFQAFIKKIMPVLKTMRDKIKPMIAERDQHNSNFQSIINMMKYYEQGALLQYADGNANKLVVGNDLNPLYIETSEDIIDKLKNPYQDYYYWIKGELYDIQALNDSFEGLNRVKKQQEKLQSKLKSDEQTLDSLNRGRTTLKTIFTGEAKKEQMKTDVTNEMDVIERDIGIYLLLIYRALQQNNKSA